MYLCTLTVAGVLASEAVRKKSFKSHKNYKTFYFCTLIKKP